MLITLCYLYLWARWGACSGGLIRRTVRRLHRTRCSFIFCCAGQPGDIRAIAGRGGHFSVFCVVFQSLDDLSKWTLLLVSPFVYSDKIFEAEHIAFVTESVSAQADGSQAESCSSERIVKWSECCLPLAYKPGEPYTFIAEATVDNFSNLGIAFMEDRLQMDNGMVPHKIVSVDLQRSTLKELEQLTPNAEKKRNASSTQITELTSTAPFGTATKPESEAADSAGGDDQEVQREKYILEKGRKPYEETGNVSEKETGTGEHHHLHLSSCHECLELENSTIESVRFASAENIPELPYDYSVSVEDVNDGYLARELKRVNLTGKPPNVLVYLGCHPLKIKFEQIKSVLAECIDTNSYAIYQLLEEQVLTVPWIDNSLLLVIATEDPISKDNHKQFLNFMLKGGKVLGLSASFTLGNIRLRKKNELKETVQALVFTKVNNSEVKLNVLASGNVFEEEAKENFNTTKTVGHLGNTDKDSMIVHLPYGDSGGEAILCQVHLEMDANSLTRQKGEDFSSLKMSNAGRYEVFSEILTVLGLSCELIKVPSLTPIYLLSSDEEIHNCFLKWLERNVNAEGIIKSSKLSLKLVSSCTSGMVITPSHIPVITEVRNFSSEHFSLETYKQNLQSKKLGKVVLFTEVTSSTMNLLDGGTDMQTCSDPENLMARVLVNYCYICFHSM
uniref:Biotin--protein ligase n=1 Tax=Sphenodon punctatus TaxID=8508 RepID=A0A8D0FYU7_SPHPU